MIHVQDGKSLNVINPRGLRITVEKQMVSLLGLAKCFLNSLALRHIVKNDNAALKCAIRTFERSAVDTKQTAFRHLWVADEELYSVNILTSHCPHQRQLVGGILSHSIRQIDAVLVGPMVGSRLRRTNSQDLLRGRIEQKKLAIRIGHNHAISNTFQNQLQEFFLPFCLLFGALLIRDVPEDEYDAVSFPRSR